MKKIKIVFIEKKGSFAFKIELAFFFLKILKINKYFFFVKNVQYLFLFVYAKKKEFKNVILHSILMQIYFIGNFN